MAVEKPKISPLVEREKYAEEIVEDIVEKLRESRWKEVLRRESIGGNAGPNRAAINCFVEKETGRIMMFGNLQDLPKEVTANPNNTEAIFIYNFGNMFQRIRNENLKIEPEFFEKILAPGASRQAKENLQEALNRFQREYSDEQKKSAA